MEQMLTPEMLGVVLPMLGLSILLNVALAAALFSSPIRNAFARGLQTCWIGLRMLHGGNEQATGEPTTSEH